MTTPIERAVEAAVAAGVPRVEAERLARPVAAPAPVVPLHGGDDRVRSWFDSVGWQLEPDALASALRMLGAADPTITHLQAESVSRRGLPAGSARYIVIPNWSGPDGFQHYRDRDPVWIKNYRTLLSDDGYLSLSGHRRGVLHGLWLEYAASGCCIRVDTKMIGRRLGLVVKTADLEALKTLGFIEFALAPRKHTASPEGEREKELPLTPHSGEPDTHTQPHHQCAQCGAPAEPRKPCPTCGATPRQAGTNPRALTTTTPVACPICGITKKTQQQIDDHLELVHDQAPA